jgi:hypothetical protein
VRIEYGPALSILRRQAAPKIVITTISRFRMDAAVRAKGVSGPALG